MILIKNATVLTLEDNNPVSLAQIEIENGIIRYVGKERIVVSPVESTIDAYNQIVMPGFVNAHSHLAMTLMRGIADDVPLSTWLNDVIFPIEDRLDGDDIYYGTMLALAESIHTGTTTISDFYMFPEASFGAIKEAGLRANIGIAFASKKSVPDLVIVGNVKSKLHYLSKLGDSLVKFSLAPHAPYTCGIEMLSRTSEIAKDAGAILQIHLHETKKEVSDYIKIFGKTPIGKLYEIGFFESKVLASHCVWVSESDMKILKEQMVNVVINPQSNLKLGSGIPPIYKFLRWGIPMALGTDGASSNNNLAIIEDMRLASYIAKGASLNPELLSALESLRMATVNGARALGFSDVGLIKEGYQADLIFIDASKANMTPLTNPTSLVAYSMYPEDVVSVMVAGNFVMKNRIIQTFDEQFIKNKAQEKFVNLSEFIDDYKKRTTTN